MQVEFSSHPTCTIADDKWGIIKDAVTAILNKKMSQYSFQQVHHLVFQICQQQCGGVLFDCIEAVFVGHVKSIYERLLKIVENKFLEELNVEWKDFSLAMERISMILLYLNKNYTSHRPTIPQMGESIFRTMILQDEILSQTFIRCVKRSLLSDSSFKMALKELGHRLFQSYRDTLYEPYVETPVITLLMDRYEKEMKEKISQQSTSQYLQWALNAIEKEKTNIMDLVGVDAAQRVETSLGIILIRKNTERLLYEGSECGSSMIQDMNFGSIHLLLRALEKVDELEACFTMIVNTAKEMGCRLLSNKNLVNPVEAVEEVLKLRDKLQELISELPVISKSNNSPVIRALTEIVNENSGFAEKLAHYYDAKIKLIKNESDIEKLTADVFGLFRLLRSKHVFEDTFKSLLAARLIHSKPEDPLTQEISLIDRVRNECGESVVNHLEIMVRDAKMRTSINKGFLRYLGPEVKLPCEFYATVITGGVWPQYTDVGLELPQCMQYCMSQFSHYYLRHHNGRKLTFHTTLGTILFVLNHDKSYELSTPASFAKTILCFQNNKSFTLEEICNETRLLESDLVPQLDSLLQLGLITITTTISTTTTTDTTKNGNKRYSFDHAFTYPKKKIRVRGVSGSKISEDNMEPRTICESSETSYSISIQAAVMQIIKSKKSIEHTELCDYVMKRLHKSDILPTMANIKQSLDVLLQKGFISRGHRQDIYIYEV